MSLLGSVMHALQRVGSYRRSSNSLQNTEGVTDATKSATGERNSSLVSPHPPSSKSPNATVNAMAAATVVALKSHRALALGNRHAKISTMSSTLQVPVNPSLTPLMSDVEGDGVISSACPTISSIDSRVMDASLFLLN